MRIRFLTGAEVEVEEIRQWYESREVGLGHEFHDKLFDALARIE
ncbi:MAG: hypothetical protein ACREJB_03800 [Planctomycetaceae bacterium]